MTDFWAKTTADGMPGISVFEHMVNVGCVAACIAEIWPETLARFLLRSREIGVLAALHDLGKISPGFQRKCEAWLRANGLLTIARNGCWDTQMESDHGAVSHAVIQNFLLHQGAPRSLGQYLATVLGAHHGKMKFYPNPRGIKPPQIGQITEERSGIQWDEERQKYAQQLWRYFDAESSAIGITRESPALWWLAGLTSVADWIGSDERFFPPDRGTLDQNVRLLAQKALDAIGFGRSQFVSSLSFHDLFHDPSKPEIIWHPNEMQEKTLTAVTGPGVYVIEAPMGMGKTEAALWAAYHLLVARKATGIYFALPTQVTSNRIHLRMNVFLKRICQDETTSRLIHANSWLMDREGGIQPVATGTQTNTSDDARTGRDWFASARRALIAPFGVGTIDQALLGVVAAKHFFVRRFALAGKVVILDEVHSYDLYTGTLIDELITTLEGLGCTVIVLSATLTAKRRGQIVASDAADNGELKYPLISGRTEGLTLKLLAANPPVPRNVTVEFVVPARAEEETIALARSGGTVLWICNTVDAAQNQYLRFMGRNDANVPIGLLHSRFPFWRREELECEWMERLGKGDSTRCGCILVATQVVEQSVDLDADFLITELAPTDMLLQRLGRLWRHERAWRPTDSAKLWILQEEESLEDLRLMEPEEIVKALGSKARVYAPFIQLRSLEVWTERSLDPEGVNIPADIRQLLESTYAERETEPDSWSELWAEWFGTDSAKKMLASRSLNLWQVALEDEEGVQTRLNEIPTCQLVLCRELTVDAAVFIDQSRRPLGNDQDRLITAQSIHKNLVKVPEYCFDRIEPHLAFADHLRGKQCLGIVSDRGTVEVKGLKKGMELFYSNDLGLAIKKPSTQEEL